MRNMSKYEEDEYENYRFLTFCFAFSISMVSFTTILYSSSLSSAAGGGAEEDKSSCSKLGLYFNTF